MSRRSGSNTRQRTWQIGVRLTPTEGELLYETARRLRTSPGAVLRAAFMAVQNDAEALLAGLDTAPDQRPKGGIEQARRNFMRDDPEMYAYIEARVAARELDRAGGDASGAVDNYGAANRIWEASARWERKWRAML